MYMLAVQVVWWPKGRRSLRNYINGKHFSFCKNHGGIDTGITHIIHKIFYSNNKTRVIPYTWISEHCIDLHWIEIQSNIFEEFFLSFFFFAWTLGSGILDPDFEIKTSYLLALTLRTAFTQTKRNRHSENPICIECCWR